MNSTFMPSPDCGTYQNQTTTLVLKEVFTEGGYVCGLNGYYYALNMGDLWAGVEISPADILGWTRPEDPPVEPPIFGI